MLECPLLLLLLAVCVTAGDYHKKYGNTLTLRLRTNTLSLKFDPEDSHNSVTFWKLDDPSVNTDTRRTVVNGYMVIKNLTQRDSGRYRMIGKDNKVLVSHSIEVVAHYQKLELKSAQQLNVTFPLHRDNCNILFYPVDYNYEYDRKLVQSGSKVATQSSCADFQFVQPCGLVTEMSEACGGRFEVRDQYGGLAMEVEVEWMGEPFNLGHIGTSIGAFLVSLFCYCCTKCCCRKCSKTKDSEEAAAEVAVSSQQLQYDNEPAVLRPVPFTPRLTYYSAQPSNTPTGPLIHNPPIVNVPPAYSEVSAPAEQADAATLPLFSDSELQFELKGMNFSSAPPLSSDTTYNSVYTSNKLEFL